MKLNLGCGPDVREGYVNLDARPVGDVQSRVETLPFVAGAFDEVLASDVLEHFWRDRTREVLVEWRRVLGPGGSLVLRVPNLQRLGWLLATGENLDQVVECIYGGHRWGEWDTHHWGWTPDTLASALVGAGFEVLDNDFEPNMTLQARVTDLDGGITAAW